MQTDLITPEEEQSLPWPCLFTSGKGRYAILWPGMRVVLFIRNRQYKRKVDSMHSVKN